MRRTFVTSIALAAALAATALAAPASSQANLYCVNKQFCIGGTVAADPGLALGLAQLNPGPDTVTIGGQAAPYVGPFTYTSSDPVTIVGAGTGSGGTTLTAPGMDPTLTLDGAESTVSNLRIEVPPGPNVGLELEGTATGVRVQETDGIDGIGSATGVLLAGGAVLEQSSVAMEKGRGVGSADPSKYSFVRDSSIRSRQGSGIWAGGRFSITRSTVSSLGLGIQVSGPNANADVADTLVRTAHGAALRADYGATVDARHLTLLNDGVAERGIEVLAGHPSTGAPTDLTLTSSIVSGFPLTLYRQGVDAGFPADATLRYSAWDGEFGQTGDGVIDVATGNLPDTTPAFVQRRSAPPTLVANLRPLAPSPLIDAADPAAPAVDHDGTPREQDGDGDGVGRSDIGAFEYVPHAPSAATIAPVAEAIAGTPVQFAAGGADDPDPGEGAQLVYRWDFGDGGATTGMNPSHTFNSAGTRTVTLTVTDPSRRGAVATTSVEVRPGPGAGAGPAPGTTPTGKDVVAPRLSGVSLSSRRLRLGGTLPALVSSSRGTQIRFTLSEPARVTLRFAPAGKAAKRPLTLVVDGKAGVNRLRFAGRISAAKSLLPGRHTLTVSATDGAGNQSPGPVVRPLVLIG